MSFRNKWRQYDQQDHDANIKARNELTLVIGALLLVAVVLLFLIPTEQKAPPGVSVWPPGTPLRIEARRDFNLKGGPLRDGNCQELRGRTRPFSKDDFRHRPHECSDVDHDIYVRYIAPDGNVFEARSDRNSQNADGAFRSTLPKVRASAYGKLSSDRSYNADIGSGMHRFEEMTYTHRFLKPGTYHVNLHLQRGDKYLEKEEVLASAFVVLYEGTPDETVVFNDRVPLNIKDAATRERTVVTFKVDEKGQLIEDSVDLETQVTIAEA